MRGIHDEGLWTSLFSRGENDGGNFKYNMKIYFEISSSMLMDKPTHDNILLWALQR